MHTCNNRSDARVLAERILNPFDSEPRQGSEGVGRNTEPLRKSPIVEYFNQGSRWLLVSPDKSANRTSLSFVLNISGSARPPVKS